MAWLKRCLMMFFLCFQTMKCNNLKQKLHTTAAADGSARLASCSFYRLWRSDVFRKHLRLVFLFLLLLFFFRWPSLAGLAVHLASLTTLHMQTAQDKNKSKPVWILHASAFGLNQAWASKETKTFKAVFVLKSVFVCFGFFWFAVAVCNLSVVCGHKHPLLLRFVAVNVLQGFQLFNQRLVLVFQHGHAVFQTFDVLFLFPATLACRLPAGRGGEKPVSNSWRVNVCKNCLKFSAMFEE